MAYGGYYKISSYFLRLPKHLLLPSRHFIICRETLSAPILSIYSHKLLLQCCIKSVIAQVCPSVSLILFFYGPKGWTLLLVSWNAYQPIFIFMLQIVVFWVMTPRGLVGGKKHFKGTYRLHLHAPLKHQPSPTRLQVVNIQKITTWVSHHCKNLKSYNLIIYM